MLPSNDTDAAGLVARLAEQVQRISAHTARVLVGVDGPDAAGKTTLADALGARIDGHVVRASIDGFHRPREARLRRGRLSAEGYYLDSFDYAHLCDDLLLPFASGADRVLTGVFDHRADDRREHWAAEVPAVSLLVFDGVFLMRPQTAHLWSLTVYLDISPSVTLERAIDRDAAAFGSVEEVVERYERRYLPGQALYRAECDPLARASVLVDNTDPHRPRVLRWGEPG